MAGKYEPKSTGVAGLTGAGVNTRFRQPGTGATGGGTDGTATTTVSGRGDVDNDVDRFVDRLMGREGAPGKNENEETRTVEQRKRMSDTGRSRA